MPRRHALPTLWLLTDPRIGDHLWAALERMPRGSGVIFRHGGHPDRRALFNRVRAIARRRGLVLLLGGTPKLATGWRADGVHGPSPHRVRHKRHLRTAPAHDAAELRRGWRIGADRLLLSPAWPTRSHPATRALGPVRFGMLARTARVPVVALGGMNGTKARRLRALGAAGWAAIDGLSGGAAPARRHQKRKAVPM